jgi:hypothetical protein
MDAGFPMLFGHAKTWHAGAMAKTRKRARRLTDAYAFPGFRPETVVRGVFGDPKARIVALACRSKNRVFA